MSGEIKGIREGREEMRRILKEQGASDAHIKKHVDDVTRRAEDRIRDGKQPRPTYRGDRPLTPTKD